jgi:hypothetical protein
LHTEGTQLIVSLPDQEIRLEASVLDAVRAATSGGAVTARSLPGLDVTEGIALLSRLLRDGIVVPA